MRADAANSLEITMIIKAMTQTYFATITQSFKINMKTGHFTPDKKS